MKKINNILYGDSEINHLLDIYLPESDSFCVFIYFHGGGLESGDKDSAKTCAEFLTEKNICVVSCNYRMYPTAVYPDYLRDAARAVAWTYNNIENYGKCSGIYIGGSSAGAYLSMMLCFDKKYLAPYSLSPSDFSGFIHDAGQPTLHFNILRERGIDNRRVIVDDASPIYHIGENPNCPPMLFIVSDNDMQNRYEQTMLTISTLKHFEYTDISLKTMHGEHCDYVHALDESGTSVFGRIIYEFIAKTTK